jgi:hypothetical protein
VVKKQIIDIRKVEPKEFDKFIRLLSDQVTEVEKANIKIGTLTEEIIYHYINKDKQIVGIYHYLRLMEMPDCYIVTYGDDNFKISLKF